MLPAPPQPPRPSSRSAPCPRPPCLRWSAGKNVPWQPGHWFRSHLRRYRSHTRSPKSVREASHAGTHQTTKMFKLQQKFRGTAAHWKPPIGPIATKYSQPFPPSSIRFHLCAHKKIFFWRTASSSSAVSAKSTCTMHPQHNGDGTKKKTDHRPASSGPHRPKTRSEHFLICTDKTRACMSGVSWLDILSKTSAKIRKSPKWPLSSCRERFSPRRLGSQGPKKPPVRSGAEVSAPWIPVTCLCDFMLTRP